ncbi:hypothetical protein UlMin_039261 [Ulmus minor]
MYFLGAMGKEVLTGGSFAISIANLSGYSILSGLAAGMEGISSQAFGAKKWSLMAQTLQRTILFLLVVALFFSLGWLVFSRSFFLLWFNNPVIASIATTYLQYSIPSLLLQAIIFPLRIFLRTQKITRPVMFSTTLSFFCQALITIYIVDHHQLGVRGIALAGALTDLLTLVFILLYLHYTEVCRDTWEGWSSECFRNWLPIVRQAIPCCVSVCLEWWWYEMMTIFANGEDAVACMGIIIQTTSFIYQFPVGNELGANEPKKARRSAIVALFCSLSLACSAITFVMKMQMRIPKFFTDDGGILSLAAATLPIVGLCELGNCPQTTVCGVLRGSARAKLSVYINVGSFYVVGLPVSFLLAFGMDKGLVGWCYGLLAAQLVCAVLMVRALLLTNWEEHAENAKLLMASASKANQAESDEEAIENLESIMLGH